MSTDDEGRGERGDEYRDPTAPPPLPDDPAPRADETQPVGTETRPFTPPPPPPPAPPQYDEPTYRRPSYDLPRYDQTTPPPDAPAPSPEVPAAPAGQTGAPVPPAAGPYAAPPPGAPYGAPPVPPSGGLPAPYAAGPPAGPYGTPPPNPYGAPSLPPPTPYGVSPYAQAPMGYAAPRTNVSAIVLVILSALLVFSCSVLNLVSLIMGIIALTRQNNDPAGSASLTRKGWWAFGIALGIGLLLLVGFFALGISGALDSGSSSYSGY